MFYSNYSSLLPSDLLWVPLNPANDSGSGHKEVDAEQTVENLRKTKKPKASEIPNNRYGSGFKAQNQKNQTHKKDFTPSS